MASCKVQVGSSISSTSSEFSPPTLLKYKVQGSGSIQLVLLRKQASSDVCRQTAERNQGVIVLWFHSSATFDNVKHGCVSAFAVQPVDVQPGLKRSRFCMSLHKRQLLIIINYVNFQLTGSISMKMVPLCGSGICKIIPNIPDCPIISALGFGSFSSGLKFRSFHWLLWTAAASNYNVFPHNKNSGA